MYVKLNQWEEDKSHKLTYVTYVTKYKKIKKPLFKNHFLRKFRFLGFFKKPQKTFDLINH